ncbi:peptidylprolyl isomerase [Paenibacillus sp. P26]|nr:peptidylprolyl isomerase [Paenibacillus sp. P26]UUZ95783.1 peptidylprolyl isomerase [Paenibacillus sp. P25]
MVSNFLGIILILAATIHFINVNDDHSATINSGGKPKMETSQNKEESIQKKKYNSPPALIIDANKSYQAIVKTNKGNFTIELFANSAPKTVNNFVFLAKEGFYNDIIFHRIIKSFMVQTGDPTGTGSGGPGYAFEDELKTEYTYEPGIVAMANAGPNTNGDQFFICTGEDSKYLNQTPNYTIFGKVMDGMDTVLKIADSPVDKQKLTGEVSHPTEKVVIESIEITEE